MEGQPGGGALLLQKDLKSIGKHNPAIGSSLQSCNALVTCKTIPLHELRHPQLNLLSIIRFTQYCQSLVFDALIELFILVSPRARVYHTSRRFRQNPQHAS